MDPLDCLTCGACCATPDDSLAAGVTPEDEARLGPVFVHLRVERPAYPLPPGVSGIVRTRPSREGYRCVCLRGRVGVSVSCDVYATRPSLCAELVPGSEGCLAARARMGL